MRKKHNALLSGAFEADPQKWQVIFRCDVFGVVKSAVSEKRGIALNTLLAVRSAMVHEDVDIVAGDFKGARWRRKSDPDQHFESAWKKRSQKARLLPSKWTDVCGFVKPPESQSEWL